jgi:hypothetical protein
MKVEDDSELSRCRQHLPPVQDHARPGAAVNLPDPRICPRRRHRLRRLRRSRLAPWRADSGRRADRWASDGETVRGHHRGPTPGMTLPTKTRAPPRPMSPVETRPSRGRVSVFGDAAAMPLMHGDDPVARDRARRGRRRPRPARPCSSAPHRKSSRQVVARGAFLEAADREHLAQHLALLVGP